MAETNLDTEMNPFTGRLQFVTIDILSAVDHVQAGELFEVPERRQMHVKEELILDGELIVAGTLFLET